MYKINSVAIDQKIKFLDYYIPAIKDKEERDRMVLSFKTLISLNYHLNSKERKYLKFINKYSEYSSDVQLDESDLNSLIDYSLKLDTYKDFEYVEPELISEDPETIVKIIKKFFKDSGDSLVTKTAIKFLNSKNIDFNDKASSSFDKFGGLTYYDIYFDDEYVVLNNSKTMDMFLNLGHEVMHVVDWSLGRDYQYYKEHKEVEIFSKMIEFYILDYLEKNGFELEKVEKLRYQVLVNIMDSIKQVNREIKLKDGKNLSDDAINTIYDNWSNLIGYSIYKDNVDDIDNAFVIMEHVIYKSKLGKKIDYSFYGVSEDDVLNNGKAIINELYGNSKELKKI